MDSIKQQRWTWWFWNYKNTERDDFDSTNNFHNIMKKQYSFQYSYMMIFLHLKSSKNLSK